MGGLQARLGRLLLLLIIISLAAQSLEGVQGGTWTNGCGAVIVDGLAFPLDKIPAPGGVSFNLTTTRDYGSISYDAVALVGSICSPLPAGLPSQDFSCPPDSGLCQITTNWQRGSPRVTAVQQLTSFKAPTEPAFSKDPANPKLLIGKYFSLVPNQYTLTVQFLCDTSGKVSRLQSARVCL